jgi:hypothetical protein
MTLGLILWQWGAISLFSLGLGAALSLALFVLGAKEKVPVNLWEERFWELEKKTKAATAEQSGCLTRVEQRLSRSEERALSYQKLVQACQAEIEQLKAAHLYLSESAIQKEREINTLKVAHLQPDLFDTKNVESEAAFQALKKECDEMRLYMANVQRPEKQEDPHTVAEQLKIAQEENERLQAELISLQQLVTELSLPEEA